MIPGADMTTWVVGVVLAAIMGTLGFLIRNAFSDVKELLGAMSIKLDGLKADVAKGQGDVRVLEAEVKALRRELDEVKQQMRDLSEGVAR